MDETIQEVSAKVIQLPRSYLAIEECIITDIYYEAGSIFGILRSIPTEDNFDGDIILSSSIETIFEKVWNDDINVLNLAEANAKVISLIIKYKK